MDKLDIQLRSFRSIIGTNLKPKDVFKHSQLLEWTSDQGLVPTPDSKNCVTCGGTTDQLEDYPGMGCTGCGGSGSAKDYQPAMSDMAWRAHCRSEVAKHFRGDAKDEG